MFHPPTAECPSLGLSSLNVSTVTITWTWDKIVIDKGQCQFGCVKCNLTFMLKGGGEDVEMGQCLQNVGVKAVHARDETGVTIHTYQ